jgi:hypothetical protein
MVHLPAVLEHADDIKPTAKYPFDEWLIGEPCVHEDVLCRDASGKRLLDHRDGGVRFMHGCGYPCFVAICTPVNLRVDFLEALFLFCGGKHVESNGDKAEAVRPSECKQVEPPDAFADDMVKYKCQQFHGFAAFSANDRIVKDQRLEAAAFCQRIEKYRHLCGEQRYEASPVVMFIAKEAVVCAL